MKITNKYNLPQQLVLACQGDQAPELGRIRVTQLINPPYIRKLQIEHWDDLEEDVSDRLWALLGTSVHSYLARYGQQGTEERLEHEIDGMIVSGQGDVYANEEIEDWKVTNAGILYFGVKPEWEAQLNVYAWLRRKKGQKVSKLRINMILRDHNLRMKKKDKPYPEVPFIIQEVPLWDEKVQDDYVLKRVVLHKNPDPDSCTQNERWKDNIRCTKYCTVNKFCEFFQVLMNQQNLR